MKTIFKVMILSKTGDADKKMEPYRYSNTVPRYAIPKEDIIKMGKAKIENYRKFKYDNYLLNPGAYVEHFGETPETKHLIEEFPDRLGWTDDQIYLHEIKSVDSQNIGSNGEVYSTLNPNGKWRVCDLEINWLPLKNRKYSSCAFAQEIDFEKYYEKEHHYFKFFWKIKIDKFPPNNILDKIWTNSILEFPEYLYKAENAEDYISTRASFSTDAVVTPDGKWYDVYPPEYEDYSIFNLEGKHWRKNFYEYFLKPAVENNWVITFAYCVK